MLRVLDLFSGIGGFSLGLERTGGFKTVAFCEIEPFCRKVLAKHWPEVPCYDDVRTLTAARLIRDGIGPVDVICGGFPCQDISAAGKGAGIDGERSGLWREYSRIIGEFRPVFVLVENVPALRTRGADRVLSDLEALGYTGEPALVGSIHAGAPHRRQRVWLVATPATRDDFWRSVRWGFARRLGRVPGGQDVAYPEGRIAWRPSDAPESQERGQLDRSSFNGDVADANSKGLEIVLDGEAGQLAAFVGGRRSRSIEPGMGRVAHGVPRRVDRLRALGNAVDPDIPELIGRAILASCEQREAA
jgi:DNA (cytosine-5)-methyltransferase 1